MLMRHPHPNLQFTQFLPYGALVHDGGVQFIIFSRSATEMRLLLYNEVNDREPDEVIRFDPDTDRWGDVWSIFVPGIGEGQLYHFQADGPRDPERGQWFDGRARLIDPYAKALAGNFQSNEDGIIRPPKCVVIDDYFDWQGDRHLRRNLSETVIYEMHVRGFTQSESSGVYHPGTYLGVIEKIPYLQSLGVTAVELMPVHEFPILGFQGEQLSKPNYWGYDPLAFFAPHRGYAVGEEPGSQVVEFKQMVKALHQAGIEVILDVVFNHTCEGNELGPALSFKGLENRVYYILENGGSRYANYTGCGNTINGNHPIVREMIFYCLRHWVHNYHIDGFRFDLASILSRDRHGNIMPNPPLVEAIAEDPMLAATKIIAEAWDAAGAYQVGSFGDKRWNDSHNVRHWAEWNGRYRDDVRGYWRGDGGLRGALATRLAGSSDLYQANGRPPASSINFITSHDGFTLNDLVSYRHKHNEANGEGNRDGDNNNFSENFGVEGPTRQKEIKKLRARQVRNMLTSLMLSQGVPMLLSGDECGRTQHGNNNAYCQDNAVSWFDWDAAKENATLLRFTQALIAFRRKHAAVRSTHYLTGAPVGPAGLPDIGWFDPLGNPVDWHCDDLAVTCLFSALNDNASVNEDEDEDEVEVAPGNSHALLLLANPTGEARQFSLPPIAHGVAWRLFIDTNATPPLDIFPELDGPLLVPGRSIRLKHHSLQCFVATE